MHDQTAMPLRWAFALSASVLLIGLSGCDAPPSKVEPEAKGFDAVAAPITVLPGNREPASEDEGSNGPLSEPSTLNSAEERQVVEAVATILGGSPDNVELDQPILNPAKDIEEFDLLEILIELEDRFDVEIDEAAIERASGDQFDDVQKRLTPRKLFGIVAEATRAGE